MNIPTAKDFLLGDENNEPWTGTQEEALIEFAKLHTKEAIESICGNASVCFQKRTGTYGEINKRFVVNGGDVYTVDKPSIINAYPLEKIL